MKKSFLGIVITISSIFLFACEEEAIPVPLPPPPPTLQATEAPELSPPMVVDTAAIAAEAPVKEVPAKKAPAKEAPVKHTEPVFPAAHAKVTYSGDGEEQLNSGKYTIQVAIFPNEASAKALVKKMAANGINSYYARVDNPAQLFGTYYRVRVGYFSGKSIAETFAKNKLEPLGYAWWVDDSKNDRMGNSRTEISKPAEESELEAAKRAYREIAKEASKEVNKPAAVAEESELEAAKRAYREIAKEANKEVNKGTVKAPPLPKK
jgi:hypothetical protein